MNPFDLICFMALSDSHGSKNWEAIHWKYLFEKFERCQQTSGAYTAMDRSNQKRVLNYCEKWKLELPDFVNQHEKDIRDFAEEELKDFIENHDQQQTKGESNDI